VDHRVSDPFRGEEKQGQDRKRDLKTFRVEFFLRYGLLAPLRRRAATQAADFSYHIKIKNGSQKGQNHHGDANGILMETVCGGVNTCGSGQCAQANGDAQAADGDDGRARALQESKYDAGPIQKPGVN